MKADAKIDWWDKVRQAVAEIDRDADAVQVLYTTATLPEKQTVLGSLRDALENAARYARYDDLPPDPSPKEHAAILRAKLNQIAQFRDSILGSGMILSHGGTPSSGFSLEEIEKYYPPGSWGWPRRQLHEALAADLEKVERMFSERLGELERIPSQANKSASKPYRDMYFRDLFDIWVGIGGDPKKKKQAEQFMRAAAEPVLGALDKTVLRNWLARKIGGG